MILFSIYFGFTLTQGTLTLYINHKEVVLRGHVEDKVNVDRIHISSIIY